MKRLWLLFAQSVTVLAAALFVVATLQPQWLGRSASVASVVPVLEAPSMGATSSSGGGTSSFRGAARAASPTVVSINTSKAAVNAPQSADPWFRFFFGDQGQSQPQTGLGSGVIVSPAGYVLTNNHVIEGADEIEVILNDGRKSVAKVIGTDPETDLAILKIELTDLPVIKLGDSDALEIGDQVLAIGNPFGVGQTVTSGIVSALGRTQLGINTFENFIQTDAAINPGNSGGALVDVNGNLMGINTAIYSRSGGSMGIGFAIPTSTARNVLDAIVRDGQVTRGWIGVEPQELTRELAESFGLEPGSGVVITGVLQNGPAAQAGIRPGDVITAVGGKPVATVPQLLSAVAALAPGTASPLDVTRRDTKIQVKVTPGRRNIARQVTSR
jgi:Do/DeqQ family serine protease